MKILVTGAKNLCAALKNIRDGKDRTHSVSIEDVFEYDIDTDPTLLNEYCKISDFVFNLAGVNRPKDNIEFMNGNFGFAETLLNALEKYGNKCPIMLSSSIQATLDGRFANSEYGKSKKAGEELFFEYGKRRGVKVLVYRFPNLFGKWCKPNYNSVVATFCNNIAKDLPIQINNRETELELVYIDDLIEELISAINGKEHTNKNGYCYVPLAYKITLGTIADLLQTFHNQPQTLIMSEIPNGSFEKKLYSTYLSYLPKEKVKFSLKMNIDERGSFTELLKTSNCGQFSVNVCKPNVTKGEHWHNSKWEFFIVVSGKALIQERKIGTDEVIEFKVSGNKIEAVHMLPGYTHNIINLSQTEDLVTLMWANELFEHEHPDTFFEKVVQ